VENDGQETRTLLQPRDVYEELSRTVIGQDEALREVSVAIVKHLLEHPTANILLIGNSGTGKTTLLKAMESMLSRRKDLIGHAAVIRINANVLAEEREGYGKTVLTRLYRRAAALTGEKTSPEQILPAVERGIVFIDEIDKIRAEAGGVPSVKGIVAQEALLTLMENENVEFEIDGARHTVNSSAILFVAGGAFEELYDTVLRRVMIGADVTPPKPMVVVSAAGEVREELSFHLRDYLRYDDLFRYGMTPQFLSRFESIVVMNNLAEAHLAKIFVEPEGSIFRTSREYFRRFGVDLQITRGAINLIAWEAGRQKRLGARALKEVYRRVIRNLEFDPALAARDGKHALTLDEEAVRAGAMPKEQGVPGRR
jgi:ATP-dependent Clp protease ATP-binding subunit ClpX